MTPRTGHTYFLLPGTLITSTGVAEISTVLGSCVSVALFDPITGVAGLNHYLLPEPLSGEMPNARHASFSMPALVTEMLAAGAKRNALQAKVFGGANVLHNVDLGARVGDLNIEAAMSFLAMQRIPVVESDIGGLHGRKIVLFTEDFRVRTELIRRVA